MTGMSFVPQLTTPRITLRVLCCLGVVLSQGCSRTLEAPSSPQKAWVADRDEPEQVAAPIINAPAKKEPFDLGTAISTALSNNPNTQIAWRNAQAAAAIRGQSESSLYPEISGVAAYSRMKNEVTGSPFSYEVTESSPRLSLSYIIFDFGERFASIRAAEEALRAANFGFNRTLQTVVYEVQRRYFILHATESAVDAAQQTISEARRSFEAAQRSFQLGAKPKQDVLQAEAVLRRAEYELENANAAVEEARAAFAEALGVPVSADLSIAEPDYSVFENRKSGKAVSELLENAMQNRPDLMAVEAEARGAEARQQAAFRRALPRVVGTMNGGRNYIYSGGSGIEENYSIGLEIQIPIFTGFRDTYRIREEEARANAAREEFRSKEIIVAREVWSSFFRFDAAQRQTQAAKALLAASAESYRAVETGYANGTNSVLDLLAAQREMSEARKSLIASQANCGVAYVELALATGGLSEAQR